MSGLRNICITAILGMAVMLLGFGLFGCATSRQVDEIKAEVRDVKAQTLQTQRQMTHMDSVITSGNDANNKLRAEVTYSIGELQQQISTLLQNYNDLLTKIDLLNQQLSVKHVITSSPGVQAPPTSPTGQTATTTGTTADTTSQMPSIDCGAAYDNAFILARQREYQKAIDGFREFLKECPNHESADNAHYWIGESYYALEKYVDATQEFQYLLDNYKGSENASRALYKLGRSQQELKKNADAKKTFQKLIDEYPETLEASQAKERLKDLK